jgi:hypothetical protein
MMMNGTVDPQSILAVIGGATTLATAIFYGAFYLGKIVARLERLEKITAEHEALWGRRKHERA